MWPLHFPILHCRPEAEVAFILTKNKCLFGDTMPAQVAFAAEPLQYMYVMRLDLAFEFLCL